MDEYRKGYIYVQEQYAGVLEETDEGYTFVYDSEYLNKENAVAISLTMPLQKEKYESNVLFPFFDGLIPEGWLFNVVSRYWKIDKNDRFGLLLSACRDCIGDVCIREEVV